MKKLFLGLIAVLVSMTLFAAPRTAEEAAAIAAQFTNAQPQLSRLHKAPRTAANMRLVHKVAKPSSEEPALYVFNQENNGGFVIVSGDDNAVTILGYSDEGSFNETKIPSNVAWWLDYYAERVAAAKPATGVKKAHKAIKADAIAPLMSSQWNQGAPYNDLCPIDPADNTRSYTGCVATAAAQIMYYYKWPASGQGERTYTWNSDAGGSGTETVDFSEATYDWSNMKDKHRTSDSEAQKTAVATLMYHVGVSCKMQYGGDASNGSGAYTSDMRTALIQNFRYKNTATLVENQSATQMASVFRTELEAGRPILMGGATSQNEGHEFVCDGIDADGYFHINWGWGGDSDGFFALSALDPDQQGAGGASSGEGFSRDVEYVKGIEPDRDPISVTGVTVDPTTATIKMKERLQLTAIVTPDNASNRGVVWSTSDATVATISASGVVIGVAPGTATMTAKTNDGNKTATCVVTVTNEVAAAIVLDADAAVAEYDDQYEEPWTIHVYNSTTTGNIPYIMFFPDGTSTNKIAGSYTLGSNGGGLFNDPDDTESAIKITGGQLIISCVGKDNGANGCNTYRIASTFTCEDGAEYQVDVTLEICAQDADGYAIDLADNVGDGTPIEITWVANGEDFASNYAVNGKLVLPADKPAACDNGKVFVGWSITEVDETDDAPTLARNGNVVTENTTFYAVYAEAEEGGSATVETTLTMEDYQEADGTFGDFTFTADKGSGQNDPVYNDGGKDVRYYTGNTLTISADAEMTEMVFHISAQGQKRLAAISATTGTIATQNSGDTIVTWTGSATSVTFSIGNKAIYGSEPNKAGQFDFTSVDITAGGGTSYSGYTTTCDGGSTDPVYYTIRFFDNGQQIGETQSVLKGQQATVPANPTPECAAYTFVGWWTAELAANNTTAKTWVTNFKATRNQDYYAIYSKTQAGGTALTNNYKKITTTTDLTTGNYIVVGYYGSKYYAMLNEVVATYYINQKQVTPSSDVITTTDGTIIWKITVDDDHLSFYNAAVNKYISLNQNGDKYNLSLVASGGNTNFTYTVDDGVWDFVNTVITGQHLEYYGSKSDFSAFKYAGDPIYLYKQQGSTSVTYYSSAIDCTATAIDNTCVTDQAIKVIRNGQLVIIRGDAIYSITGVRLQ